MKTIQIITLHGKPAAIAVNATAIIARHVPAAALKLVQAKALYALEIQAGTLPGPYTDAGADSYARRAATRHPSSPSRTRPHTPPRHRHRVRRRRPPQP